jgi:hypothetical protein
MADYPVSASVSGEGRQVDADNIIIVIALLPINSTRGVGTKGKGKR